VAEPSGLPELPQAVAAKKPRRSPQLVWLVPVIAALIGGWLAVKSIMDKGPTVNIAFATAEGLETGKTKIKYKDVDMGLVTGVALAPDTSHVVVTAELVKEARRYRAPTSAWTSACRRRTGRNSPAWRCRRSSTPASRAGLSSCAATTRDRSISARRCTSAA
jgi:hypothetical protein